MKTYVTFGGDHHHNINGQQFDKDCVAVLECSSASEGRKKAFELFGPKFSFEYPEAYWKEEDMHYYPGGYIYVDENNSENGNASEEKNSE